MSFVFQIIFAQIFLHSLVCLDGFRIIGEIIIFENMFSVVTVLVLCSVLTRC